jgi:hypothetical protein
MNNLGRPVKNLLTLEEGQKVMEPYVDDCILAVRRGLTAYQQIPAALRAQFRPRTAANSLNDFIVADAYRRFEGHEPEIVINDDYDGVLFIFQNLASVRFKKVNQQLRASNIETERQLQILYQHELPGVTRCTQLTVGYTMNEAFTQVGNIHVVCWHGERIRWAFPISEAVDPFLFVVGRKPAQSDKNGPNVRSKAGRRKKKGS